MVPWGSVTRQHLDVLQDICSLPWRVVTELDALHAVPGDLSEACWMPGSLSSHWSLRAFFPLAIPWIVAPPFPSLPVTVTHFISIVAVITRVTVALSVSSLLFPSLERQLWGQGPNLPYCVPSTGAVPGEQGPAGSVKGRVRWGPLSQIGCADPS